MSAGEAALRRGALLLWAAVVVGLGLCLLALEAGAGPWAAAMVRRSPSLLYDDALRLLEAHQYSAALARVQAALALAPERHDCHFLASTCALELGDLVRSDAEADSAIRHCPAGHPELGRYYYHRGFLENTLGRREQAIRDWVVAAHHNPDHPLAFAQLGRAYADRGQYGEARRYLQEARRLDPGNAEYALLLGTYYLRDNDWNGAQQPLQEAARLDPTASLAYRHLGYCAMQSARYGDAQYYFEKYLEDRPDDQSARAWLRRVRQRLKR